MWVDGSTWSLPATAANHKDSPPPRSPKPGVGFPIRRWLARLGLASGAVLASACGPWRGPQSGATAWLRTLRDDLRPGDVLVADRSCCSAWIVALSRARGVHVVWRQHPLRHTDFRTGRRLGRNDPVVTWTKPPRPAWMEQAADEALPATWLLRAVRTPIAKPGGRVQERSVLTTLLDPAT